jgi:hypothetical protein
MKVNLLTCVHGWPSDTIKRAQMGSKDSHPCERKNLKENCTCSEIFRGRSYLDLVNVFHIEFGSPINNFQIGSQQTTFFCIPFWIFYFKNLRYVLLKHTICANVSNALMRVKPSPEFLFVIQISSFF